MSFKRAWIGGVVGYSVLRAVIAWSVFSDYGVNPWVFAVIDVGTAIPYAWCIAELPGAIIARQSRRLVAMVSVAIVTFFAPYAYVWLAADGAPTNLRSGLVVLVVCLLGAAIVGVVCKTRRNNELIDLTEGASTSTQDQALNEPKGEY